MTGPLADDMVDPLLLALRDCLCAELSRTTAGRTCRCMVVHALSPPIMDNCDCDCVDPDGHPGQGDSWVRLVRMEADVPLAGVAPYLCATSWQAVVEIGTYRCAPMSEDATALAEQVITNHALTMGSDRRALMRTLRCCDALKDIDTQIDFYQPIGPDGGCGGGLLQFRLALSDNGRC